MLYPILALGAVLMGPASAAEPVALGGPARALSLPAANLDGEKVVLHDYVGLRAPEPRSAVVLHFYTGSAGAQTLLALGKIARASNDVQVIAVTRDRRGVGAVASEVARKGVTFPVLFDEHGVVFERYAVTDGPLTLVIDADGDIASIGAESDPDALAQGIEEALAGLTADK
ncbi:MAG: TlpA family protein disulfide reductase [Alphaproteobacteria bacterium]|nr:TlpA family protein disulfide reductase [Alphaproteobacteria bacterium]